MTGAHRARLQASDAFLYRRSGARCVCLLPTRHRGSGAPSLSVPATLWTGDFDAMVDYKLRHEALEIEPEARERLPSMVNENATQC